MMHPQVFISGLILLLPGAVSSHRVVKGVVGDPVTLPCTYSTSRGITVTCWGRGTCSAFNCVDVIIETNGYRVTYQRSSRYQLKGHISGGIVSLTIANAFQSDSGVYCCRVKIPGWFNDQISTFSLDVKPAVPASTPSQPTTTGRPTTARKHTTAGSPTTIATRPTHVPTSPRVSTSPPPTPAHTQTHTAEPTMIYPHQTTAEVTETIFYTFADWNYTVTSSDGFCGNYTESILSQERQKNTTNGFYVGISMAALLLLLFVCTLAVTRHILMKKKSESLSLVTFHASTNGSLQNIADVQSRAEDNIYIIEDSPYPME
ncbi:hepatitis A virus cellular receptor 1 homolog [Peromyscus californicus insignis]|uniref:hepatitis A virus cellular receptor 1 homolog n=1 Tax=Peromyscus californicus insignis TaxID=564181 RepID=UPI0022A66A2E|nr:hepatitis A virus cellular receptor 1 homolog [Peromyscus californicus insignis]